MKSFLTRPAMLLAFALSLAGCGGKAKFNVAGTFVNSSGVITAVAYDGLTLSNGGENLTVPAGATTFSFPKQIEYGDTYNVSIVSQPAHQTCSFRSSPTDTAGRLASINVGITCDIQAHAVTVTVTGAPTGLVLTNGSSGTATVTSTDASTTATFGAYYGTSYGITVLTQPTDGKTCTVENGTGIMGDADVTNVKVTCA
jgi:hypothetical protein